MENNSMLNKEDDPMELPPGFRFYPTDEELITHYLTQKVVDDCFCARAIGEVDLNKCEPWDLHWRAKMGEKEWYFFCVRDRKYPTGLRTNRATDAGYWKATGKDKEIYRGKSLVGMKKTLVFYRGRAPKGGKTNWVMHEYRLEGKYPTYNLPKTKTNEWVICRVFQKSAGGKKVHISGLPRLTSYGSEQRQSQLPSLTDSSPNNSNTRTSAGENPHVNCFSNSMELQKHQQNNTIISSFDNPSLSITSSSKLVSPASFLLSNPSFPTAVYYSSQISPTVAPNSQYPDTAVSMPDHSILRMWLGNGDNGPDMKQNSNTEHSQSQETGFSTNMSSVVTNHELVQRSFEDEEGPSNYAGPVDLYCLWNY